MQARSIYICSSPADTQFRETLGGALHRAGVHAVPNESDRPMSQSRPLDDALLRRCDACLVVLTRAALGAPRMLREAKHFAELAQHDPRRKLIVVLLEPIPVSDLWPFLFDAQRVEGPDGADWAPDVLIYGALQALGLPYTIPFAAPRTGPLSGPLKAPLSGPLTAGRMTLPPQELTLAGAGRTSLPPARNSLPPARTTLPPTLANPSYTPAPALPRVNRTTVPIDWESLQLVADPWAAVAEPLVTAPTTVPLNRRRSGGYRSGRSYLPLVVALSLVLVGALAGMVLLRQGAGPFSIGSASTGNRTFTATVPSHARATATVPATHAPVATATPKPTATATPLPTNWAQFVKTDTTTQGSWMGTYGAQGATIFENGSNLPAAITVMGSNYADAVWNGSTGESRALEKLPAGSNPQDRIAACWYSGQSFTMDVNITDGQTHQMALYALDWDSAGGSRSETITLYDVPSGGGDGTLLDTRTITQFQQGTYLVWRVRGHLRIVVTNTSSSNAVVSGLFFSAAS